MRVLETQGQSESGLVTKGQSESARNRKQSKGVRNTRTEKVG